MSEEQTIVINDEEHNVSELTVETQMHVARVAEIRQEIARLQMQINERQVVLNAYGEAIVNAVKPAEEPSENDQGFIAGHDVNLLDTEASAQ